jgi:hypothetical protein
MKYLAVLLALVMACAASTAVQDQEPNYLGHYIGVSVNNQPLESLGISAEWWFYEDGLCKSELSRPDNPLPVIEECEYTTPDENGSTLLSFSTVPTYRGRFSADGQYFTLYAGLNRWEFEKLGPA